MTPAELLAQLVAVCCECAASWTLCVLVWTGEEYPKIKYGDLNQIQNLLRS